jgi:hypothetical protein
METTVSVQSRLLQNIFRNYDKRILPQINDSIPVSLSIGIRLIDLVDLVSWLLFHLIEK